MPDKQERTFTVQGSDIGFAGGLYKTTTGPAHAARKAARILFRMVSYGVLYHQKPKEHKQYAKYSKFAAFAKDKTIKFLLRETTRDSEKKSFYYEAEMSKLRTPIIVNRNGVEVKIEHKYDVKVCHEAHSYHHKA
jgi:hypothetical protein